MFFFPILISSPTPTNNSDEISKEGRLLLIVGHIERGVAVVGWPDGGGRQGARGKSTSGQVQLRMTVGPARGPESGR